MFPLGTLPGFWPSWRGWASIAHGRSLQRWPSFWPRPFTIAALVIANLALGAINRAMPQLMVAFVGAPATVWGALALLAITAPAILAVWAAALDRVLAIPFGAP
jgi:flagellar biosynthesis protein FliR